MFVLKDYQKRALETLEEYFTECSTSGDANGSFYTYTLRKYGMGIPYHDVPELPGLPYVCIRIPTGGGKTIVACHSISIAGNVLLQRDHPTILWLVPSNAIKDQTLNAFKDPNHPYRQALQSLEGDITILDIKEALNVQPSTLDTSTTIIVSTMQSFRVEDTEGRKVYDSSGNLMSHFSGAPQEALEGLELKDSGALSSSLANVLRIRRPIVIVDEAHNARTELSFETLSRFKPSCIIEFTATPSQESGNASNILHSSSAAELNAESMIKLPIILETRPDWEQLLQNAIGALSRLDESCKKEGRITGEYIRPVMLLQAQPNRKGKDSITVDVLKEKLMNDHRIPEEQIAVSTSDVKGLDGIDILDKECPIRYVITVYALKEGWDCPFAYVLCSVAELRASGAVEQILGRIMRLPYVKKKQHKDLNQAYAFVASRDFVDTANSLTDALVQNGFEKQEARELIRVYSNSMQGTSSRSTSSFSDSQSIIVPEQPNMESLSERTATIISYDSEKHLMTFVGGMDEVMRDELKTCFESTEGKSIIEEVYARKRGIPVSETTSPADLGDDFSIPVLAITIGTTLEQFDASHFLDRPWRLSDNDPTLSEEEYSGYVARGKRAEITVSGEGKIVQGFIENLQHQMTIISDNSGWTIPQLVHWLDKAIPHQDITPEDSGIFITNLIKDLIENRDFSLDELVHDKYQLKNVIENKISEYRTQASESSYQSLLDGGENEFTVTPEKTFSFDPEGYPLGKLYEGSYKFQKHYYPQVGDLGEGEELDCAKFIDSLDEVQYWVRNIERRANHSFWLQTKTDKFYPDFVCLLKDGRFMVVEYKGEHLWSNDDSKEKRALGELWEERSDGSCLFIMPKGKDLEAIRNKIKKK
ncbi:MAG: DEAD/DEAH box helicase family protein [Candidatus Peribacteraceae bacterium]|nr:DEAD/DEAH box helicase family protein [Candidatus Peribacteraceae bacterium]